MPPANSTVSQSHESVSPVGVGLLIQDSSQRRGKHFAEPVHEIDNTQPPTDLLLRALGRQVLTYVQAQRSNGRPTSVLHALAIEDWLDVGGAAALAGMDVNTAESELSMLVAAKIVRTRLVDGFIEHSLALDDSQFDTAAIDD